MKRILTPVLLFAFAAPLSGCGITGNLKTPPPIWGEGTEVEAVDETAATTSDSDNSLDDADAQPGYGVDVADQP